MKLLKSLILSAALIFTPIATMAADETAAMADKATYSLVATFRVKDGQVERFKEAMKTNTAASRLEEGVVIYRTYQTEKNKAVFVNFETYVDKAAFEAHLETPHVKTIGPILDEILSGPIEVEFLLDY